MDQVSMFGSLMGWERFDLPDADVRLLRAFIVPHEAQSMFLTLRDQIAWRQDKIKFYGKEHDLPRLQQWYGDPGVSYSYSGIQMVPEAWSPLLQEIRSRVEHATEATFNTVLLNLYRHGSDTVSWHADNEAELGPSPIIASVSLGAERDFALRHNERKDLGEVILSLPHGSLLVMAGSTQASWKHSLPRRKRVLGARVNLTFRRVFYRVRNRRGDPKAST